MIAVFDLDGTIADCSHRLHHILNKPKNWPAFFDGMKDDTPIKPMVDLLNMLWADGNHIIFCTGRPEKYRAVTLEWLSEVIHCIYIDVDLYMRKEGDHRPDYVTKAELADEILARWGSIDLWFDDRTEVVKALRKKGIKVLQVEEH